ncbi:MAG: alpha/beta fold hydrolase [Gammaproteobacteria bacterium]
MPGQDFNHIVYRHEGADPNGILHIYLEGDGSPWLYRRYIAADPTPHKPLMLKLMALDDHASVYVGRPCYLGMAQSPGCGTALWTGARYGGRVVSSLAQVINALARTGGFSGLMLFGHSGGGALAMLLAQRLDKVQAVVTLAGNLDTDAWTTYHRYAPLSESLNPAVQPLLSANIWQLHLAGSEDQVVPPWMIRTVAGRQPSARFRVLDGFDHSCCWHEIWSAVLAELGRAVRSGSGCLKRLRANPTCRTPAAASVDAHR